MVFLSQDSDKARTYGLAECAKAVNKTKLREESSNVDMHEGCYGYRSQQMRTPFGMGVELGTAGPGLTSTSPEEQRRSRIRVWLKAIRTGRLVRSEQRVKGAGFWEW